MSDLVSGGNTFNSSTGSSLIFDTSFPFNTETQAGLYLNNNILTFYDASGTTITGGNALNDGNWHHIGVSYQNNGTTVLYVDGLPVYTGTCHINNSFLGLFYLGGQDTTGIFTQAIACSFNDIRMWNYARTATDIFTYYKMRVLPTSSGLVHNWLCGSTANTYLTDVVISGGFNLTSTGGMFWNSSGPTIYSQYYDGTFNIANNQGENGGVGSLSIQFY